MGFSLTYKGVTYPSLLDLAKALPMLSSHLFHWTDQADRIAGEVASLCYETKTTEQNRDRVLQRIVAHVRDSGHNTCLEHNTFGFVKKVPIFVARQDMRARHATFDERSLRFCRLDDGTFEFYIPKKLKEPGREAELDRWINVHMEAFYFYRDLTEEEILANEQARALLPVGIATIYADTRNGWSWRHHAEKRLCLRAQEEIRLLRISEVRQLIKVAPQLFGDLNMPCYMPMGCPEVKTCGLIELDPLTRRAVPYEKKLRKEAVARGVSHE
jgi:thymidylate synthase (FAD)